MALPTIYKKIRPGIAAAITYSTRSGARFILRIAVSICIILLLYCDISAQTSSLEFAENKGQWPAQVRFAANTAAGGFYLQPDGYRMLLYNSKDMDIIAGRYHTDTYTANKEKQAASSGGSESMLRGHAYDMKFVGASSSATIIPDKPLNTYNNYFIGNDPSSWASFCHIYYAVTYKNIYPGIDVRYYTDEGKLKYDIVVQPGASPDNIIMRFDGAEGITIKDDRLAIQTSVAEVQEMQPYSYQAGTAGRKQVSNKYEVKGNEVRFRLGNYDRSKVLIIDPTLVFSTFSGSTSSNWGYTATYDKQGNFYGGGIVFGNGYPANTGAFQTVFQGGTGSGFDIGIIKFNATGTNRIYATYLGGSGNEQPHSLVCDNNGNLIIAGRTNSSNYPGTRYGTGGGWDIVITKLNADGSGLVGSKIIGGPNDDGVNIRPKEISLNTMSLLRNYGDDARSEVITDKDGNIYVASCTQSPFFPVTNGAFQGATTGIQDGVVIKTSPDVSTILFASLLGGSGDDAAFALAINPIDGNIYVAGGTTSHDFPESTAAPVLSSSFKGGVTDGYIAVISPDGATHIKTTYVGTTGSDIIYGIQFDKAGYPYIMGTYTSPGVWPVTSNVGFSNPGGKQFIAKLNTDLSSFIYSTTFGKTTTPDTIPDLSPVAFLVDRCENVYVAGWGGNVNNFFRISNTFDLPTTSDAIRATSDGSDFYMIVLEKNAKSLLYGTYWGAYNGALTGDHVDGGTSRFDGNGVIYLAQCGHCRGGGTFPVTNNAWSTTNKALGSGTSGECNLAAVKISMNLAGVNSGVKSFVQGSYRQQGCIPLTVDFSDTLASGVKYIWNFGDGAADETTTIPSNSHVFTTQGSYRVRLVAIDSSTCNISDTSYIIIRARGDSAVMNASTERLNCDSFVYRFHNTSIASKPFTAQSFTWEFGDGNTQTSGAADVQHTYAAIGTYHARLILTDTSYCNAPDTFLVTLHVTDKIKAKFTTPPFGCLPYDAAFNNTSTGGQNFTWDFGDGGTSTATSPHQTYTTAGTYQVRLIAIDPQSCNIRDTAFFSVTVSLQALASFTYAPNPPAINLPVDFTNVSTGALSYLWKFGDGDSLYTIRRDTVVQHFYNTSGTFPACLFAIRPGCMDTLCINLIARVVPTADVSTAFTPNNDGINDKVYVRGAAIAKLNFRIYNRWGQMIFSTTNRFEGWDGRYKGELQPQDVYTYMLDVEFTDGTKLVKTGDVTLIR